jgi:serine protease AprX
MAFVDSGFSRHPDLQGRVIVHADCSTHRVVETANVVEVSPLSWHGQMTSVIGAGDGSLSGGYYRGIASEARLVLVKVSTPDGRIKEADILRGLRWLYDTRHRYGVRVVNVSVGGDDVSDDPDHPLHVVVRKLTEAGINVVISAGNGNHNDLVPPASAPLAITVGGYDDKNTPNASQWSLFHHNWGRSYDGTTKPNLISVSAWLASPLLPDSPTAREIAVLARLLKAETHAQAIAIVKEGMSALDLKAMELSLDALLQLEEELPDEVMTKLQARIYHHKVIDEHHQHVDGTSVAAPIVSAVIAQMLEANATLSPSDVRHILRASSDPLPHLPLEKQGAGLLKPKRAVAMARTYTPFLATSETKE